MQGKMSWRGKEFQAGTLGRIYLGLRLGFKTSTEEEEDPR